VIEPSFLTFLVPGVRRSAGTQTALTPTGRTAVDLPPEVTPANEELALAGAAPQRE
jgi:hypothetical protein